MAFSLFFKRSGPIIRERSQHHVSRKNIDPDALKVLYRLSTEGYIAYLVGGSVRDLLLGRHPKDFDVGTDARPNEIRKIFRNCFLIGKRFRLAHIIFGRKVIETSTFRRPPEEGSDVDKGLYQTEDNTFGSPEQDAKRRDFTVNGLFYDIKTFSVIDYVGGLKDLEKKVLRCIGDPNIRFREDPVRMMRAVKFAARLGFTIDPASRKAIHAHHADILNASAPRVCEEVYRLFTYNASSEAFRLFWEFGLMKDLLPELDAHVRSTGGAKAPLWHYLAALDADPFNEEASNGFKTACLHYPLFAELLKKETAAVPNGRVNATHIAREVITRMGRHLKIPKMTFFSAVGLLDAQRRLAELPGTTSRSMRFVHHEHFEEILAFRRIILTAEGGDLRTLHAWKAFHDQQIRAPRAVHHHVPDVIDASVRDEAPEFTVVEEGFEPQPEEKPHRRRRRRRPSGPKPASPASPPAPQEETRN